MADELYHDMKKLLATQASGAAPTPQEQMICSSIILKLLTATTPEDILRIVPFHSTDQLIKLVVTKINLKPIEMRKKILIKLDNLSAQDTTQEHFFQRVVACLNSANEFNLSSLVQNRSTGHST